MVEGPSDPVLELNDVASPMHNKQQSRKSLPHKKRISRKLKKTNGGSTPQQVTSYNVRKSKLQLLFLLIKNTLYCGDSLSEDEAKFDGVWVHTVLFQFLINFNLEESKKNKNFNYTNNNIWHSGKQVLNKTYMRDTASAITTWFRQYSLDGAEVNGYLMQNRKCNMN